jgi:putative ABC transport system substrate-binding protein
MRRREFITLLGGAAAAWPLAVRAQQGERVRHVGVLTNLAADDPESQARNAGLLQRLQELGWTVGRNIAVDYRWTLGDAERTRRYAGELVALGPDVILSVGAAATAAMQQATRTVPTVFVLLPDPVGAGVVESLARPGGNATGFTPYEFGMSAKWLELLKEIAPAVIRAGVIRDASASGVGQFAGIQTASPTLRMEVRPIGVSDAAEIERGITAFARFPHGGLIVTGSALSAVHHELIVSLAARHKLPAVYFNRFFVPMVGSSPTAPIWSTSTGARPAMSIASSKARSQLIFRCRRRPSTS